MESRHLKIQIVCYLFFCIFFLPMASGGATTKTVRDQLEREIRVPVSPTRVVSLAPSITEIVFALKKETCLKGATLYSDYPPEASALPRVGSYVHLDIEKIVALQPDLCIAVKDGNPRKTVLRIESFGIPVYVVNPVDLASVLDTIEKTGSLLNAREKAEQITTDIRSRIRRVESAVSHAPHHPGVFVQIGIAPIVSAGTDTFIHELIEKAGGKNLAAGETPYPRYSVEQVVTMNPEVFIITSMARSGIFEKVKTKWESWGSIEAVKKKRVHIVNSDVFDRPTPRLIEGLEMMAQLIHPELFVPTPEQMAKKR